MFPQSSKTTCFQHFSNIFRKKERLLILLSQGWSCLWHGRRLPAQRNILGIGSTFREMRCKLRSMPLSGNLDSGPVWKGGIRSQKGHWHGKSWKIMTYPSNLWVTIYFLSFLRFSDLQLVVWSSKLKLPLHLRRQRGFPLPKSGLHLQGRRMCCGMRSEWEEVLPGAQNPMVKSSPMRCEIFTEVRLGNVGIGWLLIMLIVISCYIPIYPH